MRREDHVVECARLVDWQGSPCDPTLRLSESVQEGPAHCARTACRIYTYLHSYLSLSKRALSLTVLLQQAESTHIYTGDMCTLHPMSDMWREVTAGGLQARFDSLRTNTATPAGGAHPCDPEAHLPHLQQGVGKCRATVNDRAYVWVCVCLTQMDILIIFVPTSLNVEEGGSEHMRLEARRSCCRVHPHG